jgi:signal transduction histidine kinase
LVRHVIDEGRTALLGLHTALPLPGSLEQGLSELLHQLTPTPGARLRIFVQGRPRILKPAIREQLFLIGREAVINATRHSYGTKIEIELQYRRRFCLFIRDNGCGIDPLAIKEERDSHWGLRGMHDRADNVGAQFGIWSRLGAGTEVRVTCEFGGEDKVDISPATAR